MWPGQGRKGAKCGTQKSSQVKVTQGKGDEWLGREQIAAQHTQLRKYDVQKEEDNKTAFTKSDKKFIENRLKKWQRPHKTMPIRIK